MRKTGEGLINAYWKMPGAPLADKPVAAVAVTVIVPVGVPAQDGLATEFAVGAVLTFTVNVARRALPQPSTASTV